MKWISSVLVVSAPHIKARYTITTISIYGREDIKEQVGKAKGKKNFLKFISMVSLTLAPSFSATPE